MLVPLHTQDSSTTFFGDENTREHNDALPAVSNKARIFLKPRLQLFNLLSKLSRDSFLRTPVCINLGFGGKLPGISLLEPKAISGFGQGRKVWSRSSNLAPFNGFGKDSRCSEVST